MKNAPTQGESGHEKSCLTLYSHFPLVLGCQMVYMAALQRTAGMDGAMLDLTKLTEEEREFCAGIIKRLGSGDVKSVDTELLAEFVKGLTPEVFQKGYPLADLLCEGEYAGAFSNFLARENKSPLHMIRVGFALSQEGKKGKGA